MDSTQQPTRGALPRIIAATIAAVAVTISILTVAPAHAETPEPEVTAEPTVEPTPEPTTTPTPEATVEPTPEPTATPEPAPTATETPAPTPTPTPTPTAPTAPPKATTGAYDRSGFSLYTAEQSPIYTRPLMDVNRKLDTRGIVQYIDPHGKKQFHPVWVAQYAIAAIVKYEQTGEVGWLNRAIRHADELIRNRVVRGDAWFYQYNWSKTYDQRTLKDRWWSGMAQGEALTVFSKLNQLRPSSKWRSAAWHTFQSYTLIGAHSNRIPWTSVIIGRELWFEEYAGRMQPLQVLNGQIFAIYGLWEYYKINPSPAVRVLADGGLTTVLESMDAIRAEGQCSYYCAQGGYCQRPIWQHHGYHMIHVQQLETLARITKRPVFGEWAGLLAGDFQIGQGML